MEITSAQVCEDLLLLLKHLKSALATIAEPRGLTAMQLNVLYFIKQGETTMGHVAETLHCDASNITGIVDRLVGQGLITRQENAADRRAKTLRLTAKGEVAMTAMTAELPAQLGCVKLSAADRETLHAAIAKLTA